MPFSGGEALRLPLRRGTAGGPGGTPGLAGRGMTSGRRGGNLPLERLVEPSVSC